MVIAAQGDSNGEAHVPEPPHQSVAKDVSRINAELYFIATAILLCKNNDGWDTEETRRREGWREEPKGWEGSGAKLVASFKLIDQLGHLHVEC